MRRTLLVAIGVAGVVVPLIAGTALASANDRDRARASSAGTGFELEIDPDLDARFGPRPVNAAQAAALVIGRFPGARVVKAELDEESGRPIWEVEFQLGARQNEVDVDAVTGAILSGDDGGGDDDGGGRDDD